MKRLLTFILVLILLVGVLPREALAANEVDETDVVRFTDGSYMEVIVDKSVTRISNELSGYKTYTFKDSDGNTEWIAKLTANYVFTGGSYTCTSANCTITIYASRWYEISKSTSCAGNRATANFTMGKRVLGITTEKPQYTINLYCDVNGNLS